MVIRRWRLVGTDGKALPFFTYGQLMDKINSHTLPGTRYRIERWDGNRWRYLSTYQHGG